MNPETNSLVSTFHQNWTFGVPRPRRNGAAFAIVLVAMALSGCIDLEPRADSTRFFVLSSAVGPSPVLQAEAASALSLGLLQIDLPPYLKSPKIANRSGSNEIVYSDANRWGEKLEIALGRALADNIATQIPVRGVSVFPWAEPVPHDYNISLRIIRFEGDDAGRVTLEAKWMVLNPTDDAPLKRGETDVNLSGWDGADYVILVSSLSSALSTLAQELSMAVMELEAAKVPGDREQVP